MGDIETNASKGCSLEVSSLSYHPGRLLSDVADDCKDACINALRLSTYFTLSKDQLTKKEIAPLRNVTFKAMGGSVTVITGPDVAELRTIASLLANRVKFGEFDGNIALNGLPVGEKYAHNFSFVPRETLYIPGITFLETLRFAARLRLVKYNLWEGIIEQRIQETLEIMDLTRCKNRVIEEYPPTRGELGRDMRLLSIAIEVVTFAPLIIIDDPLLSLEVGLSLKIFDCLHALAAKGLIVVCCMERPSPVILPQIDQLVLITNGYSIFGSSPENVEGFFCSKYMGYAPLKKGADIIDFAMDIALGTERPESQRVADEPNILQTKFESSEFCNQVAITEQSISAFDKSLFYMFGYAKFDFLLSSLLRTWVVLQRAMLSKFKDVTTMGRSVVGAVIVGGAVGYLQLNQGNYGYYTMTIVQFPYLNSSNLTALLFFMTAFPFVQQVLNVHIIGQKVHVFKFEQSANCCSTFAFGLATLLSEIPFTMLFAWIFGTIVYMMTDLGKGYYNYFYVMFVEVMMAVTGFATSLLYTVIFRDEIAVRDSYLLTVFMMLLLSGFPFQLTSMRSYMADISVIVPFRWGFEALMSWKFDATRYHDGPAYLIPFGFATFQHNMIFEILRNFLFFSGGLSLILLLPSPMVLKRRTVLPRGASARSPSKDSMGSNDSLDANLIINDSVGSKASRPSKMDPVKPLIFARESSITQKSRLSINLSQMGEEKTNRGPTVGFKDLTYRVKDSKSPMGFKAVLSNVSGQFDWGKLSVIVGAPQSGKSSLLHILAGDTSVNSKVTGDIYFNKRPVEASGIPLWQRCALVEFHDELYQDLTVKEIVTFAMQLRCPTRVALAGVSQNVEATIEILNLTDILHKKCRHLSRGERRRVSIAEEIVHGPFLLLIDEPTTDLDSQDESVMLMTFREMVNQDRTVIASMHQPSANVFKLFDIVLLLSKGRVIYHGAAAGATTFFINSPYGYDFSRYVHNPADFLSDISSGHLADKNNNLVESSLLENYYLNSDLHTNLKIRLMPKKLSTSAPSNPMYSSSSNNHTSSTSEKEDFRTPSNNTQSMEVKSISSDDIRESMYVTNTSPVSFMIATLKEMFIWKSGDAEAMMIQSYYLLVRSSKALAARWELVWGSIFMQMLLACFLGWLLGNTSTAIYNATSFFAVGCLLTFLGNIQFIYYLAKCNQIFLKEHARGLYSNFTHWMVDSIPLYCLRGFNSLVYSLIVYKLLCLNDPNNLGMEGYFILINACSLIASTMLSEAIIYTMPDVRSAYLIIPAIIFLMFAFSGLFIKFASLPNWLASWIPYTSLIRWVLEGNFMNQFSSNTSVFPTVPATVGGGFSTYNAFTALFSWTQDKWSCFYVVLINCAVFRGLILIATGLTASMQKGGRTVKKIIE